MKDGQQILLTDTVGFIHKLPHHLVEAFKSTLEEAKYADYIIHVVDSSNPQAEMQMHVVYETLKELGVMGKKIITLFNKQDAPRACVLRDFKSDYTLKVSAKTGEGLADLNDLLEKLLAEEQIYVERLFPYRIWAAYLRGIHRGRDCCEGKGAERNLRQSCIKKYFEK